MHNDEAVGNFLQEKLRPGALQMNAMINQPAKCTQHRGGHFMGSFSTSLA